MHSFWSNQRQFRTSLIFIAIVMISSGFSVSPCRRSQIPPLPAQAKEGGPVQSEESTRPVVERQCLHQHHTAIKTRNITMAIAFYSLFGYAVECRFRAGPARAAWLQWTGEGRLELIEVPSYLLQQPRAPNLLARPDILGYNHVALDVTAQIQTASMTNPNTTNATSLANWIQALNQTSMAVFNKTLRTAVYPPQQQIIGSHVYDIAFLYDADGCLLELLHHTHSLPQPVSSGWEPWNGTDFIQ